MSQQLVRADQVHGKITKQESSHNQSQESYAIPGGMAHDASAEDTSVLQAQLPGGHMSQQSHSLQKEHKEESTKQIPGGGTSRSNVQRSSVSSTQQFSSSSVQESSSTTQRGGVSQPMLTQQPMMPSMMPSEPLMPRMEPSSLSNLANQQRSVQQSSVQQSSVQQSSVKRTVQESSSSVQQQQRMVQQSQGTASQP